MCSLWHQVNGVTRFFGLCNYIWVVLDLALWFGVCVSQSSAGKQEEEWDVQSQVGRGDFSCDCGTGKDN